MSAPKPWPSLTLPEKIAVIAPLHARGLTAKAMAAALGAPSRNAVVGAIHRQRKADRDFAREVNGDDDALAWAERSAESKRMICVRHARAGLSNEAIAEKIGAPSAHSVAGVLRDAKFYGAALPSRRRPPPPKPKAAARPKVERRGGFNGRISPPVPAELLIGATVAFDPLPGIAPRPFATNTGCRWPVDGRAGKGLLCCGADKEAGHPNYCRAHHRLSIQAA